MDDHQFPCNRQLPASLTGEPGSTVRTDNRMQVRVFRWKKSVPPFFTVAVSIFAASCDDIVDPGVHPEAAGVVIFNAATGAEITRSSGSAQPFDNPLNVPAGGTLEAEIEFIDPANPQATFFPDQGDGQGVRMSIANGAIAAFTQQGNQSDVTGLATGTTTATIDLMHDGHSDFTSGTLTIIVQ